MTAKAKSKQEKEESWEKPSESDAEEATTDPGLKLAVDQAILQDQQQDWEMRYGRRVPKRKPAKVLVSP